MGDENKAEAPKDFQLTRPRTLGWKIELIQMVRLQFKSGCLSSNFYKTYGLPHQLVTAPPPALEILGTRRRVAGGDLHNFRPCLLAGCVMMLLDDPSQPTNQLGKLGANLGLPPRPLRERLGSMAHW